MDETLGYPPYIAVLVSNAALSVSIGHVLNLHF